MGGAAIGAVPCQYSLELVQHECGWPFPDSVTEGTGISSTGVACGWYRDCVQLESHAFTWPPGGGIQTIPYPPGITHMQANDISDVGWVVGEMEYDDFGGVRAFCRTGDGTVLDIGVPSGGDLSRAHAVSSTGIVVGEWIGTNLGAFRWAEGVMTDLTPILGQPSGIAYDVADNGLVTGWAGASIGVARAYILAGDDVTFLPLPTGAVMNDGRSITSAGNVVGRFVTTSSHAYAYLDGKCIALSELPGTTLSLAADLNGSLIVGYCMVGGTGLRGAMWTYDGQVRDLNDLIQHDANVTIQQAYAISNDGQIAATGIPLGPFDTGTVAVRLTPVWPRTGDLNCDQIVNGFDLALLLGQWGGCRNTSCSGDLNQDGFVNGVDLATLIGSWG